MNARRRISRAILAAIVLGVVLLPGPSASASEHDVERVTGPPFTRSYAPLVGVRAQPTPAQPHECRRAGSCDVIPLDVRPLDPTADQLLAITVDWDGDGSNILDAALYDDLEDATETGDAGRNDIPGLVKRTTGAPGTLTLRFAEPEPGPYSLTIASATGENRGYRISFELVPIPAGAVPSSPADAPTSVAPVPTAPPGATPDASLTVAPASRTTIPPGDRAPAPGVDGARELAVGPPLLATSREAPSKLALLAALLLVLVAAVWWRARRRPAGAGRFADVRLFWKLMLPFVVVVLAVGMIGTFATARFLADQELSDVARRLVQANGAASGYFRDQEFALLDSARFAANVQGLPEALAGADAGGAESALASVASVNDALDVVAAVGRDGRGLATLLRTDGQVAPHAGERWDQLAIVRSVLDGEVDATGDKRAALIRLADGTPMLVVAGPARTSEIVGAVVVGRRLAPMVAAAADRGAASVAVYDSSSTRLGSSDGTMPTRWGANDATGRADAGTAADGTEVTRSAGPLTLRDRAVGIIAVSVPSETGMDGARSAALRLTLLAAGALAAIIGIGYLLSRSILRTVDPLLETNRALGRGELHARAPVHGGDELGELAHGFNQMAEQLEASYQQLEQRVAERTEELQRLHRAREDFYASVSHELRTPLFAILANSELLNDPELAPDDPEERSQFLDTIQTSARQLVKQVNEILDLARDGAAEVELAIGDVDLGAVLDQVAATVEALGRPGSVAVRRRWPARLPTIRADRDRLVQILLNLGSNAVKHTPPGGQVDISVGVEPDVVTLRVADTGVGIPPDVGDRIFEPYYMVEPRHGAVQPSTGLGLFVTKRLVEAHGGAIGYRSDTNGSTFEVSLPLRAPSTASRAPVEAGR